MELKHLCKRTLLLCAVFCFAVTALSAQDSLSHKHKFTRLGFEVRAEFEYGANYADSVGRDLATKSHDYGFRGKYFNLCLGGEFGKGFAYAFRQRIIADPGSYNFFDNTDYLWLQYSPNQRWSFRIGKDALFYGGFEYDAAPIDVYYAAYYWQQYPCYQLGVVATYHDKSGKNNIVFQLANSPYVQLFATADGWKKGLLSYNLYWSGNFNHFKTLYSINLFERKRGSFITHVALGNKLEFDHCTWYLDYLNRAAEWKHCFEDFSVVSRLDVIFKHANLFVKGGYDQNLAENRFVEEPRDLMMLPGRRYAFYGLGVEYWPKGNRALRLHACVSNAVMIDETADIRHDGTLSVRVGLTWNMDFLRYFEKKLNH